MCFQKLSEKRDYDDRKQNLVITDIKEGAFGGYRTDRDKVAEVFGQSEVGNVGFYSVKRVGYKNSCYIRPILVSVANGYCRNMIVEKCKDVTIDISGFEGMKVKKDMNPMYRAEWKRLFEVERRIRIDNPDSVVLFEKAKRTVTKDGIVMDWWRPEQAYTVRKSETR